MADHEKTHDDLRKCAKGAHGNKGTIGNCEAQFTAVPGTTVEGGKVFLTPDGTATFITDGGKVFGGKVF